MDKLDRALAKALNSGDSDLIDLVLLSALCSWASMAPSTALTFA